MTTCITRNKRRISEILSNAPSIALDLTRMDSVRQTRTLTTSTTTSTTNSSCSSSSTTPRCSWANSSPIWRHYHDSFWGIPCHDEKILYEMLNLSSLQAGLTWKVILSKRENYQLVFDQWNPHLISKYDENKILELLTDQRIIRNRSKIKGIINNSSSYLKLCDEYGGLDQYLWSHLPDQKPIKSYEKQTQSPLSEKISKDLKKRKFQFVGPVIIHAYIQSIGMINDHDEGCFLR